MRGSMNGLPESGIFVPRSPAIHFTFFPLKWQLFQITHELSCFPCIFYDPLCPTCLAQSVYSSLRVLHSGSRRGADWIIFVQAGGVYLILPCTGCREMRLWIWAGVGHNDWPCRQLITRQETRRSPPSSSMSPGLRARSGCEWMGLGWVEVILLFLYAGREWMLGSVLGRSGADH